MKISDAKYKWYIIVLLALTHVFAMAIPNSCMPVLFKEISEDLNLDIVQLGTIWGMVGFGALFVVLIGGLLGDRFGLKRTISLVCFLAGLAGASRGLSDNFFSLAVTQFLFGLFSAVPAIIGLKSINIWFPRHQLGLANGILTFSVAIGLMLGPLISATVMSPWLGGWRNVMYFYGAIGFLLGIPWLLIRNSPNENESSDNSENTQSIREVFKTVVRNRNIWLIGLIFMGHSSCNMGMRGYLPLYLIQQMEWAQASADSAAAVISVSSLVGVIPVVYLSNRFGSRKALFIATVLVTAIGVGLLSIAEGPMVWVSVIIAGFVWDGYMAILHTSVMESEGIGAEHTGTAIGLVHTIGRLGVVISPPVGNSIAKTNPSLAFIFWAVMAVVPLLCCIGFLKETGSKAESSS